MDEFIDVADPIDKGRLGAGASAAADLAMSPMCRQAIFRGAAAAAAHASEVAAVPFRTVPCCAASATGRSCLWLGPDEWLVESDADLSTVLNEGLSGYQYSLVDVTHRDCAISVAGPLAVRVLNAGCPLDLGNAAFPVDMCTRTLLGKAPIILWRAEPNGFVVICWRSFAPYVWDFLIEARARL